MNLFEIMTGKLSRMSYVNRYSSFPVNRRENVAEHSWWVAFISLAIAMDLNEQGVEVGVETVLRGAILHDISEVMSGDVIRSYKHTNPEIVRAMQDADFINTNDMLDGPEYQPVGEEMMSDWSSAKHKGLEGQIVAFADMAAVALYCREEDRSGNRAIREVLQEAYEKWFSRYHDHPVLGHYIDQMFPTHQFADMLREDVSMARVMHPMVRDHSEGPTADYDSAAWPSREVPLG